MNIIWRLSNYYHLRRKGMKHAWIKSPLLAIDYWLILSCVCIALITLTLYYADFIDNAFIEQKERVKQAQNELNQTLEISERNKREADFNEELIVSMLNGSIIVNGRVKSLCVYDAAGDCK